MDRFNPIIILIRYWSNYRHSVNTLAIYQFIKSLGIPDSRIITMIGESNACNARNPEPGFLSHSRPMNVYKEAIIDYKGNEVSKDNFVRLITGRHNPFTPRDKRLMSTVNSPVLFFMTGHSGVGFAKFQDWEELPSEDIADAFAQMHAMGRYESVFWIADTCRAASLHNAFYSPEMICLGSSGPAESSYSHHSDREVGVSVIDRFSFHSLEFLKKFNFNSTIYDFHNSFNSKTLLSNATLRSDLSSPDPRNVTLAKYFFGNDRKQKIYVNGSEEVAQLLTNQPMINHVTKSNLYMRYETYGELKSSVYVVPDVQSSNEVVWSFTSGTIVTVSIITIVTLNNLNKLT